MADSVGIRLVYDLLEGFWFTIDVVPMQGLWVTRQRAFLPVAGASMQV